MKNRVEKYDSKTNLKIYYQLNQLNELTGLSSRMLKYKMLKVKKKYYGNDNLLYKDGKRWQIHYSIINEFMPLKRVRNNPISYYDWKCFVTWNPFDKCDVEYHYELIKEIKQQLPDNNIKYAIELDKRGNYHTHFICDAETIKTKRIVESVIKKYFYWHEIMYQVADIKNTFSSMRYIAKAPQKSGVL